VWKRHRRFAGDGTWARVLAVLVADADAAGLVTWQVSVDSSIARAHQHATTLPRAAPGTGGRVESQEIAAGAA
jgi:transposase